MYLKLSCDFLCTALPKYKSKISTTKKSKRGGGMDIENSCSRYSFLWARTQARVRSEILFYKFAHLTKILSITKSSRSKKS